MKGNWSWVEMCGPGGLIPWSPSQRDIGSCFQQLFLLVPVLIMFAIVSAYYYGSHSERRTHYYNEKCIIQLRFTFSLLIAVIPVIRFIVGSQYVNGMFRPVDYLTAGVEIITWFVHSGYVLSLRHHNRIHGPIIVRVLWTILVTLAIINLRSQILTSHSTNDIVNHIKFGFCFAIVVLQICYGLTFLFACGRSQNDITLPRSHTRFSEVSPLLTSSAYQGFIEDIDPEYLGVAMENESFTSKLVFHWVYSLMKKGSEGKLDCCDDLYDLPHNLNSSYLSRRLHTALGIHSKTEDVTVYGSTNVTVVPKPEKVTLFKALHTCFKFEFYSIGIIKFISDVLNFAGPLLLNRLVSYIENKDEPISIGLLCAFGLFITTFFGALANVHFNFFMAKVGLKLRGALISTIYRKILSALYLEINDFSTGEITNFMSTDTERIVNSCASFHSLWSIPLQLIVTFYLLYMQVGVAFIAGVIFTIILIPVNKAIASKICELSIKLMEQKDLRVSATTEMLLGMRVLKMHVWEEFFLEKILKIRLAEIKHLKARKYLDALCVYFWAATPILISILTFTTYSLMGYKLTAATVFTTMALLNMLISPLNAFPWILNGLTEAWVSLSRVQKLLDSKDNNFRDFFESNFAEKDVVFSLKHCSFQWSNDDPSIENNKDEGTSDNIESNISESKELVINETGITNVCEVGNISESKKQFVLEIKNLSISEGNLVGVIGPVGSGKSTFLAALIGEIKKTRGIITMKNIEGGCALVTQTPWIQKGTIRENILFGKSYDSMWYKSVIEACCLMPDLETLQGGDLAEVGEGGMTLSGGQRARLALARAVYQNRDIYLLDDVLASVDVEVARSIFSKVICGLLKNKTRVLCTHQVQLLINADFVVKLDGGKIVSAGRPSEIFNHFEDFGNFEIEYSSSDRKIEHEINENKCIIESDSETNITGPINAKVYKKYWTAIGHFLGFIVLMSFILMQLSRNITDYWLSYWVSEETKYNLTLYTDLKKHYLSVYGSLAFMNTIFTFFRAFLFAYSGIQAAVVIHEKLLKKILSSKIVFFDISPIGRILNRFSNDTYTIDDSLPFILNIFLAQFFGLIGSISMTIYGLPWLCLVLVPLVPVYYHVQVTYRCASRELKRLCSSSLSPVFCHFQETLQGLTTIRAFRTLSKFRQINDEYLERNQKAIFASQAANQWLNFNLQMIGVVMVTGVAVIASLQHKFDVVDSAIIGLVISYTLSTTSLLNGVVSSFTETEKEMISMERVGQYLDEIESESEDGNSPPYGWLSQGVIIFQGVYLKYREHIPPSLNGISFETRPAEKVGVVGRTGAGKSSLIVALLRLVNVSSGKIFIDTVNINELSLQALRSRISVIPQDPFLFEGSVRTNVDPLGEFTDSQIMSSLQKCHMKERVEGLGGLSAKISSGGKNFSQGERQLLCLARAVLRNAKIVCVDEATAFVDTESDKKIQHTIRSSFRQSTVLTIAHRISTIMDCDRILVLNDGEVVEFDSPKTLALDENSYFYHLCQQEIH